MMMDEQVEGTGVWLYSIWSVELSDYFWVLMMIGMTSDLDEVLMKNYVESLIVLVEHEFKVWLLFFSSFLSSRSIN